MQFKSGDTVIPIISDQEQTPPQKLEKIHTKDSQILYELTDGKKYPALIPGDRRTWALVTLRHGYSVIPIEAGGKKPLIAWKAYQIQKPTENEINTWWSTYPDANLAVICGEISDIVVLDIDNSTGESYVRDKSDKRDKKGKIIRNLPDTPTAVTGKGKHLYFQHPSFPVGNFARKIDGLDLRGDGGYVVAPGSWHSERQTAYEWQKDKTPWDIELLPIPIWLLELLQEEKKQKPTPKPDIQRDPIRAAQYWQYALQNASNMIRQAPDGAKHDTLIRASRLLGGYIEGGIGNEHDAVMLLEQEIAARPDVRSFDAAQKDIQDGIEHGRGEPITYEELETDRDSYAKQFELPPLPEVGYTSLLEEVKALREVQSGYYQKGEDSPEFTEEISDIISRAGNLTESEFELLFDEIEKGPDPLVSRKRTRFKKQWREVNRGAQILGGQAIVGQPKPSTWPYRVKNNRIEYLTEQRFGEQTTWQSTPVCDFTARIETQITDENGERTFVISGNALRGSSFRFEMTAEDFGNERKLKAVLDGHSGGKSPVRAGMTKHLSAALQLLTDDLKEVKRYKRTGWSNDGFLIPGRERKNISVELKRKLPYKIHKDADFDTGLMALEHLIKSVKPELVIPVLATVFQAPLARLANWGNERYGIFISGRTGSFKTSVCQCAMAIYGPGFMQDELLVKWGEGATSNAMMGMSVMAHDMPFLIDNFKPNVGYGVKSFIGLIHNIVEGGEKDRLNRAAELRDTRPVFCWPICTGEDVPDSDSASLARILVVPFPWQQGEENASLTLAQKLAFHLCAVGNAWIDWLESDDSQKIIRRVGSQFETRRAHWSDFLKGIRTDISNPKRVASNLATNELTWQVLCEHPTIGELAQKHRGTHLRGLEEIISVTMAEATAESLEAKRFLEALKELLSTGRAVLYERDPVIPLTQDQLHTNRDRHVGWHDSDGIYLLPLLARNAVERLIGGEGLNKISAVALYKQLKDLEIIKDTDVNRSTKRIRVDGKLQNVLVLDKSFIESGQEDDEIPF